MRKLLPVLLVLIGLGAGAAAGFFLKPARAPAASGYAGAVDPSGAGAGATYYAPSSGPTETLRLPSQFVVPVIVEGRVEAMVVIGLALQMSVGHGFDLAGGEARLRAVFLQLLFDHANIGGFSGLFTSGEALLSLRRILREAARSEIGSQVQDVLITELLRQES
ncbi:MAG: flagellar basal body-associated protein FliL [Pararhodobacter sp.]